MENVHKTTGLLFLTRLKKLGLDELWSYVVKNNPSKDVPYHNNYHMFWMAWLADQLWQSLPETDQYPHGPRNMIIAALFHDYDHSGGALPDYGNIGRAVLGWYEASTLLQLPEDVDIELVATFIRATEYPYANIATTPQTKCLRDADLLYTTVMGDPHIVLRDLRCELQVHLGKQITEAEMAEGYKKFIHDSHLHTEMANTIRLECFPTFLLTLALRGTGVTVVSPSNAEAWLKE